MAARMSAKNQQANQNRADQHDNPDIEAGVERLIASGRAKQAGTSADGAESEIEFSHPSAGNDQEPQKNGGNDGKYGAEDPRAGVHRRGQPNARGGIGRKHLPDRNQEKYDRMHQRNNGALAVSEDGEPAHRSLSLYPNRWTSGCDPDHARLECPGWCPTGFSGTLGP